MLKVFLSKVIEAELKILTVPVKVPEYTPFVIFIIELTPVAKAER